MDDLGNLTLDMALDESDPAALLEHSALEPEVQLRPSNYYRALRDRAPVHYDERIGMYLVSRHEDLLAIARDPETFSVGRAWNRTFATEHFEEFQQILMRDGGGYFPDAIMTDPPQHTRVRSLLQAAFTPSRIKMLEPLIRETANGLLDTIAPLGRADGVKDFALPMTLGIMCRQLGVDPADGERILRWSRAYSNVRQAHTREEMVSEAGYFCELQNYVIDRVKERQASRTDDMISDLIHAKSDDGQDVLSLPEVVSLARALLIGGLDSIGTALSNMLFLIASDPEIAAAFDSSVGDETRLLRFIEEMLRYEPPARGLFRATTRDFEIGGVTVPADSMMCLLFASANDDETVFDEPRRFNMDRERLSRNLTFGAGIHMCVGMHLARMQIKVAAQEIHRRLKDIRLAVPREKLLYHPTLAMLSLEELPLTFTAR